MLGETDPDLVPIFADRGAARVAAARRRLRYARQRAGDRRPDARALHAGGALPRRVPSAARRAPGRQRGDRARGGRGVRRRAARAPRRCYDAFTRVRSPGRLEIVGRHPLVLLDGAHNVAGAEALRAALAEEFAPAPRTLVVGLLRERDPVEMLTRARARRRRATRVRAPAEPARAGAGGHRGGRGRARLPGRAHRGRRHGRRGGSRARCSSTPADGEIVDHRFAVFRRARPGSLLVDR